MRPSLCSMSVRVRLCACMYLELGGLGLLERDGDAGNGVVVGAALEGGEHREVDLVLQFVHRLLAALLVLRAQTLAVEYQATAGTTVSLRVRAGRAAGEYTEAKLHALLCFAVFVYPLAHKR